MSNDAIAFFVLAGIGVASAIMMVTRANPVNSALFLILNFLSLAGIYLTLSAQFVAIVQIVIYAGAVMVLVLFVIMLLNLQDDRRLRDPLSFQYVMGIALAAGMFLLILMPIGNVLSSQSPALANLTGISSRAAEMGTVEGIGASLFTDFFLPVQLTAMLLLIAMIGAIVLAKKRFPA